MMTRLDIPVLVNAYDVDGFVWRSAQPPDEAWPLLKAAGCRAVIALDQPHYGSHEAEIVRANGMGYDGLNWNGVLPPTKEQVGDALSLMDSVKGPILIHCEHGSDRTGTLCAIWRMHHDGWSFEEAMKEAFFDLGTQGMHEFWMAAAAAEYAEAHHAR